MGGLCSCRTVQNRPRRRNSWKSICPTSSPRCGPPSTATSARCVSNDVETLDALFRDDPRTIRFGGTENLFGFGEIKAFRAGRSPVGLARTLSKTVITT